LSRTDLALSAYRFGRPSGRNSGLPYRVAERPRIVKPVRRFGVSLRAVAARMTFSSFFQTKPKRI